MASAIASNKTKIAKRVIEVLEFFASGHRHATVMDIVRAYGRPQSSTSELLGALVEMGLLYKDPHSRSYAPTPRLASLGNASQPEPIASGRVFKFMDRLAQATRAGVGLFGIVGTQVQLFHWTQGERDRPNDLKCGDSLPLSSSPIGLLLLSTAGLAQAGKVLWRLNAEAEAAERFDPAEANEAVAHFGGLGSATGPSGFLQRTHLVGHLLPETLGERRLALGVLYPSRSAIDPDALLATIAHGVESGFSDWGDVATPFVRRLAAM